MNKIRKNESGFSAIEIIMIVVIIGLIGAVGYLVFKNHNKNTKNVGSTQNVKTSTQSSSSMAVNSNIIKIPELGVEITVPDSIKNITYTTDMSGKDSQGNHYATAIFNDGIQKCSIASLSKINGQYADFSKVAEEPGNLAKQYGSYFIVYYHPQATCGNTASDQTQFEADTSAFSKALPTIRLVQ